jgi:DNA repair exonuclease SbcCD ATPase subunit
MTIAQLNLQLSDLKSKYHQGLGRLSQLRDDAARDQVQLDAAKANIDLWEKVRLLLTKTSEFAREQAKTTIERLVTMFLQAAMDQDNISFHVVLSTYNDQPAAYFEVRSVYGENVLQADPADSKGGGIMDIVSLALHMALHQLTGGHGLFIVDEPTKMLSSSTVEETEEDRQTAEDYQRNIGQFLRDVTARFGWQTVLCTHSPVMADAAGGTMYKVRQDRQTGISEVKRLGN